MTSRELRVCQQAIWNVWEKAHSVFRDPDGNQAMYASGLMAVKEEAIKQVDNLAALITRKRGNDDRHIE